MKKKLLISLIIIWFGLVLFSVHENIRNIYNSESFRISEIPQASMVRDVIQDRSGLLWIGTVGGIYIYTGHTFIKYPLKEEEGEAINSPIFCLFEDREGLIWSGIENGLLKIDYRTNRVKKFLLPGKGNVLGYSVRTISQDRFNNLWVGTNNRGLFVLNKKTGQWKKILLNGDNKNIKQINVIKSFNKNIIWVGTDQGLFKFSITQNNGNNMSYSIKEVLNRSVNCMVRSEFDETIYLGTIDKIYSMKSSDGQEDPPQNLGLTFGTGIQSLYSDENSLWVGVPGILLQVNLKQNRDKPLKVQSVPINWGGAHINKIIRDREGNFWVASSINGLYKFNLLNKNINRAFHSPQGANPDGRHLIWDVKSDLQKNIWIGAGTKGLIKADFKSGSVKYHPIESIEGNVKHFGSIQRIFINQKNKIFLSIWGWGLFQFNPVTEKFTKFKTITNGLLSNRVTALNEDQDGQLLIGTVDGGLQILNNKNEFKKGGRFLKTRSGKLLNVTMICRDKITPFTFWIGTLSEGLFKFNSKTNELKPATPLDEAKNTPNIRILYICQPDFDRNLLYTGTSFGLTQYNIAENRWVIPSQKKVINQSTVLGILDDKNGYLWVSTMSGLYKYDPKKDQVFTFSEFNHAVDPEFNDSSCYKLSSEMFWFGSVNGALLFNPERIEGNPYTQPIQFLYYTINDIIVRDPEKNLKFKTSQRIGFGFSSVSYLNSSKNTYQYKLIPRDQDWKRVNTNGLISFSDLKSGKYELLVKGANNDGIQNRKESILKFKITGGINSYLLPVFVPVFMLLIFLTIFLLRKIKLQKKKDKISYLNNLEQFYKQNNITTREQEILKLWIEGKSREEIEDSLYISYHTVKNHIQNIYKKLKVSNRGELLFKVKYDLKTINKSIE